jgi:hypothetical protein
MLSGLTNKEIMNIIKRFLATLLITFGMTFILLGVASAIGIIVIIACPFIALAQGIAYWEASRNTILN